MPLPWQIFTVLAAAGLSMGAFGYRVGGTSGDLLLFIIFMSVGNLAGHLMSMPVVVGKGGWARLQLNPLAIRMALGLGTVYTVNELLVMLAYKNGAEMSVFSPVGTVSGLMLSVLMGVFMFKEHLSRRHIAGLALALSGIICISAASW
ncbi:MAG: hypothetical protein GC129_06885 [Proteobacteria bacterium]|nr:hypothetical protein [Pseudomonadota bacterium]